MTGDSERGEPLSWGAHEGAGPLRGSREASFRAEPATEGGSNPLARPKIRRETSCARGEGLERLLQVLFLCLVHEYRGSVSGYRKEEL